MAGVDYRMFHFPMGHFTVQGLLKLFVLKGRL